MAGGNCEKDTFDNDCHDPILNDATLLMVWFVCCLFDDCQSDSDVEDDSNGGGGNDAAHLFLVSVDVDDVGDDNDDDHDDDDEEVDEASTRSPSSSCSSAQAELMGQGATSVRVLLTDFTPTHFLTSKYC